MNKFKAIAVGLLLTGAALIGYNLTQGDAVDAAGETRECSANSIITCGAMSSSELKSKYAANKGNVKGIYSHYGITASDIANSTNVKTGYVSRDGKVTVDGKVVATGAQTVGRKASLGGSKVNAGGSTVYQGSGRLKSTLSAYVFTNADGTFKAAIIKVCGNPVPAVPVKPPTPPKPTPVVKYACEKLTATKISRTEYKFDATATAENATIKSYAFAFGDGQSQTVTTSAKAASINHNYAKEGTYTATVTVVTDKGQATSATCRVSVTVEKPPVVDKPSIDIVKTVNGKKHIRVAAETEFTYEITVRNTGNVALKDAVVTDKAPAEVTLLSADAGSISNNVWTYTIPELKVGESKTFTIKAKYPKYAEGIHKNTVCVDTPTVPGSPDDCDDATTETPKPTEVCDIPNKKIITVEEDEVDNPNYTKDYSKCDETPVVPETPVTPETPATPVTPTELPKTGMAESITSVLGVGSLVGAGYAYIASRRNTL